MAKDVIVVPLDGSELSESALPYADALAKALGAGLLLVTVWESAEEGLVSLLPDVAENIFKRGEQYYAGYLTEVAKRIASKEVPVETVVVTGEDAAEEIVGVATKRQARMLVLASHGRSGIGRWWYGSVTNKIVQQATVPAMILGPGVLEQAKALTVRRILVPLDGSGLAEAALPPAVELADALGADVLLAQVLRWASQAYAFEVPAMDIARIDKELTAAAQEYLDRIAKSLKTKRSVETKVLHGMSADALVDLIDEAGVGIVVMASHGRGGLARVALGSVTDRMVQGKAPVVVVRPQEPS